MPTPFPSPLASLLRVLWTDLLNTGESGTTTWGWRLSLTVEKGLLLNSYGYTIGKSSYVQVTSQFRAWLICLHLQSQLGISLPTSGWWIWIPFPLLTFEISQVCNPYSWHNAPTPSLHSVPFLLPHCWGKLGVEFLLGASKPGLQGSLASGRWWTFLLSNYDISPKFAGYLSTLVFILLDMTSFLALVFSSRTHANPSISYLHKPNCSSGKGLVCWKRISTWNCM